ncbi:M24 family metallopeptidase [Clostridium malenominatum]|uniref:M24 family metallopeptidase n=1 Tax=Clostridium malenominatum TaxID=1539 RepID=A0ABP3TSZ9_9CLOT
MKNRREKIKKLMIENNIDVAIVSSPENVFYVANYAGNQHCVSRQAEFSAAIMWKDDVKPCAITMDFEKPTFEENTDIEVLAYDTWVGVKNLAEIEENIALTLNRERVDIFKIIHDRIEKSGFSKGVIGLEMDYISHNFYNKLLKILPEANFVNISTLFVKGRSIKTKEEIDVFRKITKVEDEALLYTSSFIKAGVSERELINIYRSKVMESKVCVPSSWSMLSSGVNSSKLTLPTDNVIKDGDIFKFDGGVNCEFSFYTTDMSRSYIIGKGNPTLVEVKKRLYDAQRLMIENIKPGMKICDLFKLGYSYVKEKYSSYERGHLGHSISIGPQTCEYPVITPTENTVIEEGMIFCIEVPMYIRGVGGFNIEDMVLVTKDGAEVLTYRTPHYLQDEIR